MSPFLRLLRSSSLIRAISARALLRSARPGFGSRYVRTLPLCQQYAQNSSDPPVKAHPNIKLTIPSSGAGFTIVNKSHMTKETMKEIAAVLANLNSVGGALMG